MIASWSSWTRATRARIFCAVIEMFADTGLTLQPTFVPFTPWTTLEGYRDLLEVLAEQGLVENVAPIQLAIRLLIPAGSRMLELAEIQRRIGAFDSAALYYPWQHGDAAVDALACDLQQIVERSEKLGRSRMQIFERIGGSGMAGRRCTTKCQRQLPNFAASATGKTGPARSPSGRAVVLLRRADTRSVGFDRCAQRRRRASRERLSSLCAQESSIPELRGAHLQGRNQSVRGRTKGRRKCHRNRRLYPGARRGRRAIFPVHFTAWRESNV